MNDQVEHEDQEDEVEETSLRDDMEAAISQVEGSENDNGDNNVEETPEIEEEKKEKPENGDTPPGESTEAPAGKPEPEGVKAPQSWSPKLREDFGKLPPQVQAQINKRETEMTTFLNEGAESRKFGDKMNQTLQPYQSVMAAHGTNDPVAAVDGLMKTAATLQMGTPQQKAQKLADMVQHYGIDIQALDNALSGQPMADPQTSQLEQLLEQKLAPFQQFMGTVQQSQQQSQQQVQQNAQSQVSQFEQSAEFISDVRNDMADLLDMASKRGQEMTLQQAYDKACAINPDINAVLQQRANDEKIKGNAQQAQNKRYAASSIRGNQSGNLAPQEPSSLAGAINQAWDDVSGS